MSVRRIILYAAVVFALLSLNFHCGETDVDEKPFDHEFQIPVKIYPLKKSYSLSDTIWIETDVSNKFLFDTKTNQFVNTDTGRIDFAGVFNRFETDVTSPPDGFCDVITVNGVNAERRLGQWSTTGSLSRYGCSSTDYRCRIGFRPKVKGTYWLALFQDRLFGSCPNKLQPPYASLSFKYDSNADLNLDILNSLPDHLFGGKKGKKIYVNEVDAKEVFIARVE